MKNDDWSLKGKKVKQEVADDGDGYIDVWEEYTDKGHHYKEDDIDTLREKLIKDIKNHYWNSVEKDRDIVILHCIKIINKRFGVKK